MRYRSLHDHLVTMNSGSATPTKATRLNCGITNTGLAQGVDLRLSQIMDPTWGAASHRLRHR